MAVVVAAIANGGRVYRPRLVLGTRRAAVPMTVVPPELVRRVEWTPEALSAVRGGMYDVIMAASGTGARARIANVEMAGKTGTAEYGLKEEGRKHGWMLTFAPFDHPRYAVAMVVDDALSGGTTVAPRIHQLMSGIFSESEAGG
jgi:penicillin-binding protein 2